jgi:predicted RecA/RadA family phage recombinase
MATATYLKGEKTSARYLAGGAIVVDQVLVVGTNALVSVGIAGEAMASGDTGIVYLTGVYDFPKVSGAVIKCGESVDWDLSAGEVDDNQATSAAGDVANFGIALEDAGNGVTTIKVALTPNTGTLGT